MRRYAPVAVSGSILRPVASITMRSDSNFVSKDEPEQMFHNDKWEQVHVEVFLRVGPSSWRLARSPSTASRRASS